MTRFVCAVLVDGEKQQMKLRWFQVVLITTRAIEPHRSIQRGSFLAISIYDARIVSFLDLIALFNHVSIQVAV